MKKLNKQKGITLIALIITIIVMLILVAVTISMAVNGGLFEKAGKATGDTKNAMNAEQALANGQITIDGKTYASIDDYLAGNSSAEHNWTRTGDTFTCSHCNATYEMGQVVNYTAKGKASTTISAVKSGLDKYYATNSRYPSGANVDSNGNQTIEAKSTTWVVLGIEDTDGDKIYETLLITTGAPTNNQAELMKNTGTPTNKQVVLLANMRPSAEGDVHFYGAAGYNNAASYIGANGKKVEGEIDRICRELYSNSEYGEARGITIEDVNSALNYEPIGGYYSEDGSTIKTTGNLTTKLKDLPTWDAIKANHQTPDGTNTEATLGEYEINGYYYQVSSDGTALTNPVNDTTSAITNVEKNTIFGASKDFYYWLASRGVYADADYAYFGPGFVDYGFAYSYRGLFVSVGGEGIFYAGLRPVVSLKSKLPTVVE